MWNQIIIEKPTNKVAMVIFEGRGFSKDVSTVHMVVITTRYIHGGWGEGRSIKETLVKIWLHWKQVMATVAQEELLT